MLKALIDYQSPEERKNTLYGLRELLNSIDYNNLKQLETLLSSGIYPDQQSADRRIPLHSASYLGNEGAVDLLLKYNASVDLADGNGVTPLMLATGKENVSVVKKLLKAGANPDYIDDKDLSALDIANMVKNAELIELLGTYSATKKLPKTKTTRKRSPKTVTKRVTRK
jgi:ankyrin repeat protein